MSIFNQSVNEVVATSIRREREAREWTRSELAREASAFSNTEWSDWRIIDLEGGRTGSPPASARWEEIVALSNALRVPIWDLVLPPAGQQVAIVDRRERADGTVERVNLAAEDFAAVLSGFDGARMLDPLLRQDLRLPAGHSVDAGDISAALRSLASKVDKAVQSSGDLREGEQMGEDIQ